MTPSQVLKDALSRIPEDIDRIATDIVRADYSEAPEPEYAMYRAIAEAINAERERLSAKWNPFINLAPRGRTITASRAVKGKTQEISEFVPDYVWLATKCGKVLKSYWIPEAGKVAARWSGLATGEHPIAWQAYVVPDYPFQAKASDDNGATGQAEKVPADSVTGDASRPSRGGDTPAPLIIHKHIFLDDVGGSV